jgi:hypothetical protein
MTLREAADRPEVKRALSVRAYNVLLVSELLPTIGELRDAAWHDCDSRLMRLPNVGRKTRDEVRLIFGYPQDDGSAWKAEEMARLLREEQAIATSSPAFEWAIGADGWLYGPQIDLRRNREIAAMVAGGMPLEHIAAKVGLTSARVGQIAKKVRVLEAQIAAGGVGKVVAP